MAYSWERVSSTKLHTLSLSQHSTLLSGPHGGLPYHVPPEIPFQPMSTHVCTPQCPVECTYMHTPHTTSAGLLLCLCSLPPHPQYPSFVTPLLEEHSRGLWEHGFLRKLTPPKTEQPPTRPHLLALLHVYIGPKILKHEHVEEKPHINAPTALNANLLWKCSQTCPGMMICCCLRSF